MCDGEEEDDELCGMSDGDSMNSENGKLDVGSDGDNSYGDNIEDGDTSDGDNVGDGDGGGGGGDNPNDGPVGGGCGDDNTNKINISERFIRIEVRLRLVNFMIGMQRVMDLPVEKMIYLKI